MNWMRRECCPFYCSTNGSNIFIIYAYYNKNFSTNGSEKGIIPYNPITSKHLYPEKSNTKTGVSVIGASYCVEIGDQVPGSQNEIADGTEALDWIRKKYISKSTKESRPRSMSDAALLAKAQSAPDGEEFNALMKGENLGAYDCQEDAELALCKKLAFWAGKGSTQMAMSLS